jgi:hypothetical protein
MQRAFGTAALGITETLFLLPFPLIVSGADELRRWLRGQRDYSTDPGRAGRRSRPPRRVC